MPDGNPKTEAGSPSLTSFILPHEEAEAKAFVASRLKDVCGSDQLPRPCGFLLSVMLHITPEDISEVTRDDGTKVKIYQPQMTQDKEKYTSLSGLVVGMGDDAYTGENADGTPRFGSGPWCKVGDFVLFPRYEAALFGWKPQGAHTAVPMISIADDKIQMVIESPTDVEPINIRDRV